MFNRLLLFLFLTANLADCANNSFSGKSSNLPTESNSASSEADVVGMSDANGSVQFVADGMYYALEYKQACADGGPISIILVSSASSQASLTRQSCVNLSVPKVLNIQNLQITGSGLFSYEGQIYVPGQI